MQTYRVRWPHALGRNARNKKPGPALWLQEPLLQPECGAGLLPNSPLPQHLPSPLSRTIFECGGTSVSDIALGPPKLLCSPGSEMNKELRILPVKPWFFNSSNLSPKIEHLFSFLLLLLPILVRNTREIGGLATIFYRSAIVDRWAISFKVLHTDGWRNYSFQNTHKENASLSIYKNNAQWNFHSHILKVICFSLIDLILQEVVEEEINLVAIFLYFII